jgi:ABC-type dipeptide/oligopeptide/nickel transport system permease component
VSAGLATFVVRRTAAALLFVAVVSSFALVLARLAPGDATTELFLAHADAATIAQARERLGLDRPIYVQLGHWLGGLAHFDLGQSSRFGGPVAALVGKRALKTAELALVALVLGTVIGLPLGVLTGARPRGLLAALVTPFSIALVACPPIVGALGLLVLALSTNLLSTAPGSLAVPVLALALPLAAMLERLQSQATSDALGSPDLTAAAARGIPPSRLLWIHATRQSLRPVLGIYGIVIGSLFSGSLAVEWVTAWPGLGRLTYDAIVGRDMFLVAGCALFGAVLIACGNLSADIIRAIVDPRVKEGM